MNDQYVLYKIKLQAELDKQNKRQFILWSGISIYIIVLVALLFLVRNTLGEKTILTQKNTEQQRENRKLAMNISILKKRLHQDSIIIANMSNVEAILVKEVPIKSEDSRFSCFIISRGDNDYEIKLEEALNYQDIVQILYIFGKESNQIKSSTNNTDSYTVRFKSPNFKKANLQILIFYKNGEQISWKPSNEK